MTPVEKFILESSLQSINQTLSRSEIDIFFLLEETYIKVVISGKKYHLGKATLEMIRGMSSMSSILCDSKNMSVT